ncbi:HNH endonuclease [Flexivirga meconopsidis]|uniref:HNH endonuclease n=1 Tax=Flexivirga meconopsidis TaxID=2977121 RepID=UPI00223F360E|nr:DUF222 domain-containing protein [Flexivirga meconopsidis]
MSDALVAADMGSIPIPTEDLRRVIASLPAVETTSDPQDCLALIRTLEELKNVASTVQASLTVNVHDAQLERDRARGLSAADSARVTGQQIAFARRQSPHRGSRLLGLARAITHELPATRGAMRRGLVGEHQAFIVCRETSHLRRDHRQQVDRHVAKHLGRVSDRRLEQLARARAYELDPGGAVTRRANAEHDRYVSLRPAPDCMTLLTALLPVKDGVGCYAALKQAADAARPEGDERGRGQVMADTLVERVTGRAPADGVDVQVKLLVPLATLIGASPDAAVLDGFGPIPADLAREIVAHPDGERSRCFLRRMFTAPGTGELVAMESPARVFPKLLAELIAARDQLCRTPFCGAPIRHTDHILRHVDGGVTSYDNGQGLCERCNYVKEHPDLRVTGDATRTMASTAGFDIESRPPPLPGRPVSPIQPNGPRTLAPPSMVSA